MTTSDGPPKVRLRPAAPGIDDPRACAAIDAPSMGMPVDHHPGIRIAFAQPSVAAFHARNLVAVDHREAASRQRDLRLPRKAARAARARASSHLDGTSLLPRTAVTRRSDRARVSSTAPLPMSPAWTASRHPSTTSTIRGSRCPWVSETSAIRNREPESVAFSPWTDESIRCRPRGRDWIGKGPDGSKEPDQPGRDACSPAGPGREYCSRSSRRRIFPTLVFGRSCANSMCRGRL